MRSRSRSGGPTASRRAAACPCGCRSSIWSRSAPAADRSPGSMRSAGWRSVPTAPDRSRTRLLRTRRQRGHGHRLRPRAVQAGRGELRRRRDAAGCRRRRTGDRRRHRGRDRPPGRERSVRRHRDDDREHGGGGPVHAVEIGTDLESRTLVAFGGGAPLQPRASPRSSASPRSWFRAAPASARRSASCARRSPLRSCGRSGWSCPAARSIPSGARSARWRIRRSRSSCRSPPPAPGSRCGGRRTCAIAARATRSRCPSTGISRPTSPAACAPRSSARTGSFTAGCWSRRRSRRRRGPCASTRSARPWPAAPPSRRRSRRHRSGGNACSTASPASGRTGRSMTG